MHLKNIVIYKKLQINFNANFQAEVVLDGRVWP